MFSETDPVSNGPKGPRKSHRLTPPQWGPIASKDIASSRSAWDKIQGVKSPATCRQRRSPLFYCVIFFLGFLVDFTAPWTRAAQPSLEVLSTPSNQTLVLRLRGEGSATYILETSTNLTSWQPGASIQTTNGTADFSFAVNSRQRVFLRAAQELMVPDITVQLQAAENLSVSTILTPEGGVVELRMPDLRQLAITFPSNSVSSPIDITVSLVTNIVGLPFAGGSIGAVKLEPEGLLLMGAASLTINLPAGIDGRTVMSFTAANDGKVFSLTPDRLLGTNQILIPFSEFSTYGSAIVTRQELEGLIGPLPPPAGTKKPSIQAASLGLVGPQHQLCVEREQKAGTTQGDPKQFTDSANECFPDLVTRALAVQSELNLYIKCEINDNLVQLIALERQKGLLGDTNTLNLASYLQTSVCGLYESTLTPLWQEATNNCPLGNVLMRFMISFESQMALLGITNAPCNYTVFGNLDKVCDVTAECVRETQACCFQGHRGQQKYLELVNILKQYESIGYTNCFPKELDDPRIQLALDYCLTNAWYGSFTVREVEDVTKTTHPEPGSQIIERTQLDLSYNGGIFKSDESNTLPGLGRFLSLTILGEGLVKLDDTYDSRNSSDCGTNPPAMQTFFDHTVTIGRTNGTYDTNFGVAFGSYSLAIKINPDNTSYQITGAAGPMVSVKVKDVSYGSSTTCEGKVISDPPFEFDSSTSALFPMISETITRPLGSDTNHISGTYRTYDLSSGTPIDFTWDFHRLLHRPP